MMDLIIQQYYKNNIIKTLQSRITNPKKNKLERISAKGCNYDNL